MDLKTYRFVFSLILGTANLPLESRAFALYSELQTGLSGVRNLAPFYPGEADPSGYGLTGGLGLGAIVENSSDSFQIHLMILPRVTFISGADRAHYWSTVPIGVRFEVYRFYFGAAFSPITVLSAVQSSGSAVGIQPGAYSWLTEAGLVWRVVPFFHILLGGTAEGFIQNGSVAAPLQLEIGLRFRFFLIGGSPSGSASESGKYDGWRYPFGISKH